MELLAPAGSKEGFKAALMGGADAIYLGGQSFGARGFAENFTEAELNTAVSLAHDNRVKVYVTVNTLIKEAELSSVFSYLEYLESLEVDAVIIQDLGLLRLIQDHFSLPIHASTQMGIHSPHGVVWAAKHGIRRVILARELYLEEVHKIRESTDLELEVFIHGALCYSFSGQCLFSSIIGGRSGNRGLCTQPCRKRYILSKNAGYLLSTADLFGVKAVPVLLSIGVNAVKIEGRMRSATYVYLTSKIYSNVIRRAEKGITPIITEREQELLEVIFNRGFSQGHLLHDNIMHRTYAGSRGRFLGQMQFDGEQGVIQAETLHPHDGVTLYRHEQKIGGFAIKRIEQTNGGVLLTPPFRIPQDEYQVYKTKDRTFDAIQREIQDMPFPVSPVTKRSSAFSLKPIQRDNTNSDLSFYLSSLKALKKVLPYADRVYFQGGTRFDEAESLCNNAGIECVLVLPRVSFEVSSTNAESLMISTLGQFEQYRDRRLYGHYSMNFFNSLTLPNLYQYTLSVELSRDEIRNITRHYAGRIEVMVFGRIELMISRDSSVGEGLLIDPKHFRFPVYPDRDGFTHILNSADLCLLDYLDELEGMGVNSFGIDLRRRAPALAETVAHAFFTRDLSQKTHIKRECGSITARHYRQGVT